MTKRYIKSDDKPFTFHHIMCAGENIVPRDERGFPIRDQDVTKVTGLVFIGRRGQAAVERLNKRLASNGMSNGERKRLAQARRAAEKEQQRFDAMPATIYDPEPVERTAKFRVVNKPEPHGAHPYDVYVRAPRTGEIKLRSYTGLANKLR